MSTSSTVYGTINQNGGIEVNGNFTSATRLDKGKYRVNLKPETFSTPPAVVATVMLENGECGDNGTNRTISVTHVSATEICFGIRVSYDKEVRPADRPFSFIAMGPF